MTGHRTVRPTRRQFLLGGAVAGAGAAVAVGADTAWRARPAEGAASAPLNGDVVVPFHGAHQAGIDTAAQAHAVFVALDLLPATDGDGVRRMMRILSDDAARLSRGEPALADSEPELATSPARLTVTFGFGPGLIARVGGAVPDGFAPLPPFGVDRLRSEYSDGDVLLQVASDDPVTVAHTARMLLKDARSFATLRWTQRGFRRAHGSVRPGTTMRNLFGQVDGTTNPEPGTPDFDAVVWSSGPGWAAGGTGVVVRRIAMDLDGWDRLDRPGRDQALGRFQSTGAPLTGTDEFDEPDFGAANALGFPVIPEFSHLRRARSDDPRERIFRRAYNYDDAPAAGALSDAGLIFVSFQGDIQAQFVPIQRRLDELDLLNEWTTPVGSAIFFAPPGCAEGGYIGEGLLG